MESNGGAPASGNGLSLLQIDLEALVEKVVSVALSKLDQAKAEAGDKIAFDETEAARLIGVAPHVLRDARLRGEISASRIMRARIRYLKSDLLGYLLSHRWSRD